MNEKTQIEHKKTLPFALAVIGLTAVAIALNTLSLLNFYEADIGYFVRGAVLPMIFNILLVVGVVFMAGFAIFALKKNETSISAHHPACKYAALLPVAAFGLLLWDRAYYFFDAAKLGILQNPLLSFLSPLFTMAAVALFISYCLGVKPSVSTAVWGTLTIAMLAYDVFVLHSDLTIAMNSPQKLSFNFAALSAMLFIVAELRIIYGVPKPRFYLFSIGCATLFLGAYSLPYTVAHLVGTCESVSPKATLASLALFIFVLVRFISAVFIENAEKETSEITNESVEANETANADIPDTEESSSENTSEE